MTSNYQGPWKSWRVVDVRGIDELKQGMLEDGPLQFLKMMIFDGGPLIHSDSYFFDWSARHYPELDRIQVDSMTSRTIIKSAIRRKDGKSTPMTEHEEADFSLANGWHGLWRGQRFGFHRALGEEKSMPLSIPKHPAPRPRHQKPTFDPVIRSRSSSERRRSQSPAAARSPLSLCGKAPSSVARSRSTGRHRMRGRALATPPTLPIPSRPLSLDSNATRRRYQQQALLYFRPRSSKHQGSQAPAPALGTRAAPAGGTSRKGTVQRSIERSRTDDYGPAPTPAPNLLC